MITPTGSAVRYQLTCTHDVDGVATLFDPDTVEVSFVNPIGAEDVLTYGGVDDRDNQISKVSTGVYSAFYVPLIAGAWSVRARWEHTSGGVAVPCKSQEYQFTAVMDGHNYTDG